MSMKRPSVFAECIEEAKKSGFKCYETTIALAQEVITNLAVKAAAEGINFAVYKADVYMLETNGKANLPIYILVYSQGPIELEMLPQGYVSHTLQKQTSEYKNPEVYIPAR